MGWHTTTDVDRFLARVGPFLRSDPLTHHLLLTEADFWSRAGDPGRAASFGWSRDGARVDGAWLHLPDHSVVCSRLAPSAAASLLSAVPTGIPIGVDARDLGLLDRPAVPATEAASVLARIEVLRLGDPSASGWNRSRPLGAARLADRDDLSLLHSWFEQFRRQHPDDTSSVEFVIDHPVDERGLVLWESEGRPVAMASRTSLISDVVRLGLVYQPEPGPTYAEAALDAACLAASRAATHVLAFSGSAVTTASYLSRGFELLSERVVLVPPT